MKRINAGAPGYIHQGLPGLSQNQSQARIHEKPTDVGGTTELRPIQLCYFCCQENLPVGSEVRKLPISV